MTTDATTSDNTVKLPYKMKPLLYPSLTAFSNDTENAQIIDAKEIHTLATDYLLPDLGNIIKINTAITDNGLDARNEIMTEETKTPLQSYNKRVPNSNRPAKIKL